MKTKFITIISLALLLSACAAFAQDQEDMSWLQEYQQQMAGIVAVPADTTWTFDNGFSLHIPEGWSGTFVEDALMIAHGGQMMDFTTGTINPVFVVGVEPNDNREMFSVPDAKMKDFWQKALLEEDDEETEEEEPGVNEMINVIAAKNILLAGHKAVQVDATAQAEGMASRSRYYIIENGDSVIHVAYSCPPDKWKILDNMISSHIKSFKF